jgi:hypothetical protein
MFFLIRLKHVSLHYKGHKSNNKHLFDNQKKINNLQVA